MTEEEIQFIAQARADMNGDHPTTDPYIGNLFAAHLLGVRGEVRLADHYRFGYDRIREVHRGSDGGYDFVIHFDGNPLTIDVKTRDTSGDDLLMPTYKFKDGQRCADILVLARCFEKRVTLIGFEHPILVKCMHPTKLTVMTHVRPWDEIRQMWQLDRMVRRCDEFKRRA